MARKRQRGNGAGTLIQRRPSGAWIAKWYAHTGKRCERSTRTTDKRAAERIMSKWTTGATLRREGVIDARAEALAQQARRPLTEHLADFNAALLAKGASPRHAALVLSRARAVVTGAGFKTWADISASRAMEYLNGLRADRETRNEAGEVVKCRPGISAQTFNFYLQAIRQFGRWMVKDRRAADSPLAHLEGLNVKLDRRHDRRALTTDELRRLLTAADKGGEIRGMNGPARALLYWMAVETGLRAGELRSLTRGSFKLDGDTPQVTVGAAYSKRRRDDTLLLRSAVVEALRPHLAHMAPDTPVFKMPAPEHLAEVFKVDLAAAGIAYRDTSGRYADFHCLRHTFISNLAAGGVYPKTAQLLARHSTITLTMDRYTHQYAGDEAAALDVLPDLSAPAAAASEATGTDGKASTPDSTPTSSTTSSSAKQRMPSAARCDQPRRAVAPSGGSSDDDNSGGGSGLPRAVATRRDAMQNGGGGIRTPEALARLTVFKTDGNAQKAQQNQGIPPTPPPVAPPVGRQNPISDPDLQRLIGAWPELPSAIRRAVLALVDTACPVGGDGQQG